MLKPMKANCKTCPFVEGGWEYLQDFLADRALSEGTPICHSTGPEALKKKKRRVSLGPLACRGARDLQLKLFFAVGFLAAPTDQAWEDKAKEMGL